MKVEILHFMMKFRISGVFLTQSFFQTVINCSVYTAHCGALNKYLYKKMKMKIIVAAT